MMKTGENERDLVMAAEKARPRPSFHRDPRSRNHVPSLTQERCDRLQLHAQSERNTARLGRPSCNRRCPSKFGEHRRFRPRTAQRPSKVAIAEDAQPQDLLRPGHINPLRSRDGGVLVRAGQTEGSVDLARLAGLNPRRHLRSHARRRRNGPPSGTRNLLPKAWPENVHHRDLISYRLQREPFVRRIESVALPTQWGEFQLTRIKARSTAAALGPLQGRRRRSR